MPPFKPQILHSMPFSSTQPPMDTLFVDKALNLLKFHPYHLKTLTSQFTPKTAFHVLLKSQRDRTLILNFLKWAQPNEFFDPICKCAALHILTRFKLYETAKTIAQDLAKNTEDDTGSFVFSCLKETYHLCNSSSAVIDLVVKSYSHLNLIDKALNIVNFAKNDGLMPGVLSYNAILDCIIRCKRPIGCAQELYKEMIASGVSLNVYSYNVLIRGFCGAQNLDMGLKFFREMEENGCLPNVVTHNTIIDGYCKLGRIDDALGLFRSMTLKGLEPNLISCNIVVNGLSKEGKMEEASAILKEMNQKGLVPDEVTFNTLVGGHCKQGNFHQALVLLAEMVSNGLLPNVVTYTSLINCMCKAGNLNRAMELLREMDARGLHPNKKTYTTLINGFSQQGFMNEAYRVLNEMTAGGFAPSIVTYNALVNGYCVLGKIEDGIALLREMEGRGLYPDVVSYSTIISGFSKNGELDRAFEMMAEMREKGIPPDSITFTSIIHGVCEEGRVDEACRLLKEMMNMGLVADEFTYTSLMNARCKQGDMKEAFQLHDEMIQKGFFPDAVTYSVLINGVMKQARTREAKNLLLRLASEDSVPNDDVYVTMIESCRSVEFANVVSLVKGFCMNGLMNEADRTFRYMIDENCRPSESVYNVIIHGHCRAGGVPKAYSLYEEMLGLGFVPHTITLTFLVKSLFNAGMHEELNRVIVDILKKCQLTGAELAKVLVEINHKEGNMDVVFNVLADMAKDGLLPSIVIPAVKS